MAEKIITVIRHKHNESVHMREIRNIILDLAGVVMNLDLEKDQLALDKIGFPDFYELKRYPKLYYPTTNYLNGLISATEFCNSIIPYCKEGVNNKDILDAMDAVLADIPGKRLEMIERLHGKYRIYLLSNIYETAWLYAKNEAAKEGYMLENIFDGIFLSYELKLAKPDRRIFSKVIEVAGIDPKETAYFDDTKENIMAAQELGIESHLVKINSLEESISFLVSNI